MSEADAGVWSFRVYVVGGTLIGDRAVRNLRSLVDRHLPGRAEIEVVDLRESPEIALEEEILAVPTVDRVSPPPRARVIGDLSDAERIVAALDLPAAPA